MFSNRLAFAALSVACVTAAGTGAYLATRQGVGTDTSAASVATPALPPTANPSPSTLSAPPQPVEETEGVVGDERSAKAPSSDASTAVTAGESAARQPARVAPSRDRQAQRARVPRSAAPAARESVSQSVPIEKRERPSEPPAAAPVSAAIEVAPTYEQRAADPPVAPEPPERTARELVVSADSVIGLQTDRAISSERARVEDQIEARVVRDVRVGGEVAIPAGSRALGSVIVVDRGGKFKDRARLGIRFHTLVLSDGTRLPVTTETIYRYGEGPGNRAAAKIGGGAVAGAILGAILGGAKGAAVGASTGAAGGTATVAAGGRSAAEFPAGTEVTARILSPVTVTVDE
jgi:hypothetical protein